MPVIPEEEEEHESTRITRLAQMEADEEMGSVTSEYLEDEDQDPSETQYIPCHLCRIDRPATASHCYECGLCINGLHHHCPWVGKCVAVKNHRTFNTFNSMLKVHLLFGVFMFLLNIITGRDLDMLSVPGNKG